MNQEASRRRDRTLGVVYWVAAVAVAALWLAALGAASARADEFITTPGSGAGEALEPAGLAVDASNGTVYVADRGNRRVDVFDSAGNFLRAFGWGVVASGPGNDPRNEIEKAEVAATGGGFTLLFIQNSAEVIGLSKQETASIPFDATSAAVQSALESLPAIAPGDVAVSGAPGGPWTIEFTGAYADTDVHELEEGSASALTGGAGELKVTTTQPGANYEVCEASAGDVCRAGQRGVEAGQLSPTAIAVDPTAHDVYVYDGLETSSTNEAPNNRVQKFSAAGTFLYMLGGGVDLDTGEDICTAASGDACGRGAKGAGAGEFDAERGSLALGPGGVLHVNDGGRAQKFEAAGAPLGEVALAEVESRQLAVDSAGNTYGVVGQEEVRKFDPSGTVLNTIASLFTRAIAVDSSDELYLTSQASGRSGISRYDSAGNPSLVFYSAATLPSKIPQSTIAPNLSANSLYTVDLDRVNLIPLPSPGPVTYPLAQTITADPIGSVRATLNSEVNPEGKATTFHYEYVDQASFQSEGGWASPAVEESAESASIGSDFTLHAAQATVGCTNPETEASSCLTPETVYHFRAVPSNADGSEPGPEGTFETKAPVEFGPLWSTAVGTDSTTLHAEVNPVSLAATGFFEVVDDAAFAESEFATAFKVPAGEPLDFGSGEALLEHSAQVSSLAPGTTYHYRLSATDHCKPAEPSVTCTFESEPETFTTFAPATPSATPCPANAALRTGPAGFLADCRGYEMVSPVDKGGTNVEVFLNVTPEDPANLDQSATNGQSLSFSAYKSFGDAEGSPYMSQYISRRGGPGAWATEPISPPREGPTIHILEDLDFQFKVFTADLCFGWWRQETTEPLLAPGAIPGYTNLYRRESCGPETGAYRAESTTEVPVSVESDSFRPILQGFSADGSRAFFAVLAKLTSDAKANKVQVYEAGGEAVKLVCVLPNAKAASEGCGLGSGGGGLGERAGSLDNAVSEDGSRAFFSAEGGRLYVRIDGERTVAISDAVSSEPGFFWGAAADGSTAVFTVGQKLYEFNVDAEEATPIAEGVAGVAGMSDDASRIYFVSDKALAPGAEAGKPNLYLAEGGEKRLVATMPDASLLLSPIAPEPSRRTARVSPSGEEIVFMSSNPLTGYDNTDAASGEADYEVFRYDAGANEGAGALACLSCNPGGARPAGDIVDRHDFSNYWAAAWIPTWTNQLYAPRVISEDGNRVFFNSNDALIARDTNGAADVYEWEAPGSGDCSEGAPGFIPASGGCLGLLSSGQSPEDSEYVDSSASGEDVFFRTYSSLAPQDPGLLDIYDARAGGGTPPAAPQQPECEGEACQSPPAAPDDPTPASAAFQGAGNAPAPKPCKKGAVRRHGKCVAKKHKARRHHKKKSHHKRAHHRAANNNRGGAK